ncbi:hypothetical protein FG386_000223 [Cryptosporidium ryanae]|uniref:uncharacterized protein n=1 Tax=Cryptosporidium ryanae TaxID=515981 RepID=UPI00351A16E8|nr:hypothetical protein FG386_000223 [Cryptosporidium ryanae]
MVFCFRAKKDLRKLSYLNNESIYPPLIKIQRSLVIPGFINECRELSRALSLDIYSFDHTISETSTVSSPLSKITSKSDVLNNYEQDYVDDDNLISSNDKKPSKKEYSMPNSNRTTIDKSNDNLYSEGKIDKGSLNKQKSKIFKKTKTKRRVFSLPTNTEIRIDSKLVSPGSVSAQSKNKTVSIVTSALFNSNANIDSIYESPNDSYINHDYNFNGGTKNVSYSNPNNQFKINKKVSNTVSNSNLNKPSLKNEELSDFGSALDISIESDSISNKIASFGGNLVENELSNDKNSELNQLYADLSPKSEISSKNINNNVSNHRSSLRILVQSVINLMNKRGSRGRNENAEVKSIINLINIDDKGGIHSSESNSEDQSEYETKLESESESKNSLSSYKQVSFNLYSNSNEHNPINNIITNKEQGIVGEINCEPNKKLSLISMSSINRNEYKPEVEPVIKTDSEANLDTKYSNYYNIINKKIGIGNVGVNSNINNINGIHSFHLSRSISSESLFSNYSHEQRVARTYDMQIITYDQTAIPIPNLPRGQLKVIEDLENCFIILNPKLSNIFSCCC